MVHHLRRTTDELEVGNRIMPFGKIVDIFRSSDEKYVVTFDSGKTRNLRSKTSWWVEPPENETEKETNMVSHRRSPKRSQNTGPNPLDPRPPEVEDYVHKYETAHKAAEKALVDARLIAGTNPEQATLFLHEATVQAQLAQAASGMVTAAATHGQTVEFRVVE